MLYQKKVRVISVVKLKTDLTFEDPPVWLTSKLDKGSLVVEKLEACIKVKTDKYGTFTLIPGDYLVQEPDGFITSMTHASLMDEYQPLIVTDPA